MSVLTTETSGPQTGGVSDEQRPDPEVPAKAKRRTFTAAFKAKVLAEYEAAPQGTKGQVLRKYGVGSWHISDWRKARAAGAEEVIAERQAVLDAAFNARPDRFRSRRPRHPTLQPTAWINKPEQDEPPPAAAAEY